MSNIAVIGSGTWGTALAQVADDNGHKVTIYGHNPDQVNDINNNHKKIRVHTCTELFYYEIITLSTKFVRK